MTLMHRIHRAGQEVESGWGERDVERVWQGLRRKRRRRAVVAAAGVASVAVVVAVGAMLVVPRRDAVVKTAARSAAQSQSQPQPARRDETVRFTDGSTAVPRSGTEASLVVVEDTPQRIVVVLGRGGARFDVIPRPEREFSVRAGGVTVTVLGTTFSVERVADRVGVTVTRGVVRVDWGAGGRRLAAGEDGWFPPLVVSPTAGEGPPEAKAKDVRPVRHQRKLPEVSAAPRAPAARIVQPPAAAVPVGADAAKLLADADRARLAGRFEEGAALLERLVREYPNDPRAPLATFSLGRLLRGELGRPADAARAFARARAMAPDGPLANDALASEAEAWARAGDHDRARAREAEYRARTRTNDGQRP